MKLPKYINLFDDPVNANKHAGQVNYQRINDLLRSFEAVEIGEIMAAGFVYEIYGIELDLNDAETKELFPHLADRACAGQYYSLLADFDVNHKAYKDRCEKNRANINIRWHGKGGKIETEKQEPEATTKQEEATKEEATALPASRPDMTDAEIQDMILTLRKSCASYDVFRQAVINKLENGMITVKDKFYLLDYGRQRY